MGGIPMSKPLKQMVGNGIMLIGDAARTVNPLSGGGIILGMKSAKMAAEIAVDVLNKDLETTENNLKKYERLWMKIEGKNIERLHRLGKAVYNLTNDELNNIVNKLNKIPDNKKINY